jgi:hypothetical protein
MSRKTEMLPGAQAAGGGTSGIGFTLVNPLPGVRSLWAVFVAAVLQRLPFALLPPDSFVAVKKTLLVLSYLLLVWALSRNLEFRSVRLILVGVLLNFAAIVANGGLMPVSPEARSLAGMTDLGESWLGSVTPEGTGIILGIDQARLGGLTDILPVPLVGAVFSVGDVILGVALVLFLAELIWGRRKRNDPLAVRAASP